MDREKRSAFETRVAMSAERLAILVPDFFLVPPVKAPKDLLPPMPGTVHSVRQLDDQPDPIPRFLVPFGTMTSASAGLGKIAAVPTAPIRSTGWYCDVVPCDIDADAVDTYLREHETRSVVEAVFKDRWTSATAATAAQRDAFIDDVMRSFRDPFRAQSDCSIVWTLLNRVRPNFGGPETKLGGKKKLMRHKELVGQPWSIACFGNPEVGVRRNLIYDDRGECVAQIDFGHGQSVGIHLHALVSRNYEHTAGDTEDHLFPLKSIPWPWIVVPDMNMLHRGVPGHFYCYNAFREKRLMAVAARKGGGSSSSSGAAGGGTGGGSNCVSDAFTATVQGERPEGGSSSSCADAPLTTAIAPPLPLGAGYGDASALLQQCLGSDDAYRRLVGSRAADAESGDRRDVSQCTAFRVATWSALHAAVAATVPPPFGSMGGGAAAGRRCAAAAAANGAAVSSKDVPAVGIVPGHTPDGIIAGVSLAWVAKTVDPEIASWCSVTVPFEDYAGGMSRNGSSN